MTQPVRETSLEEYLRDDALRMTEQRAWFHAHPERAHGEKGTVAEIARILSLLGYEARDVAGGVVAETAPHGPYRAYRADIDALPINEVPGRPYGSTVPGMMHACGHDGHIAIALAIARWAAEHRSELPHPVRFIFQPAEETASGAMPMIDAGALEDVMDILGVHLWSPLDVGTVVIHDGAIFGNVDRFQVVVHGKGGHGGLPHRTKDPVVAASHMVTALQSVVSRRIAPFDIGVVTVGRIAGGTAFNIVPDSVEFEGTVRTFDAGVQGTVHEEIRRVVEGIASAWDAAVDIDIAKDCPAVVNHPAMVKRVRHAMESMAGRLVETVTDPVTVGDDMAFFHERVPGCYLLVGSGNAAMPDREHHQRSFDLDPNALPLAAELCIRTLLETDPA